MRGFTNRQREVVALIAKGRTYPEIGVALGISRNAAKAHADVVRHKLGVEKRRDIPQAFHRQTGENPYTLGVTTDDLVAA